MAKRSGAYSQGVSSLRIFLPKRTPEPKSLVPRSNLKLVTILRSKEYKRFNSIIVDVYIYNNNYSKIRDWRVIWNGRSSECWGNCHATERNCLALILISNLSLIQKIESIHIKNIPFSICYVVFIFIKNTIPFSL